MPLDKAGTDIVVKYNTNTKYEERKNTEEKYKRVHRYSCRCEYEKQTQKKTSNERNSDKD